MKLKFKVKKIKGWSRYKKVIVFTIVSLAFVSVVATVVANILVNNAAKGRCYSSVDDIPYRRVGVILGTSRFTRRGTENFYFKYRIQACANLYHNGKISYILVSGDNGHKSYNEPADMRKALIAEGVPDSVIVLDYAGFSTYDSMVRTKKIFGQDSVTVISQNWHNKRALFIAKNYGIDAVGFNANDVAFSLTTTIREWLARTKMVIDLLFQKEPHFLGDPIEI
ncbi:MAG: YdcF family protein [Bacteroidales bacterium]|nr:YdcF family protein [Bacteroidales bacterium]